MTKYSEEEIGIRRERREQKRTERDARRALRLRRHGKGQPGRNLYTAKPSPPHDAGRAPGCWFCGGWYVTDTVKIKGADGQPQAAFVCEACRPMAREIEQAAAEDGPEQNHASPEDKAREIPDPDYFLLIGRNGPDGPDQLKLF